MIKSVKDWVREVSWRVRAARGAYASELSLTGSILIIAPHPDDEAIGCGGLIARLVTQENAPHVAILTGGGASLRDRAEIDPVEVITARRGLTLNSARVLGLPVDHIHFLDFEDGSISSRPEREINRLRELITELHPANIFVPHRGEGWPDHLAVREIGIELAPDNTQVWEYCVWMWYYNVWNLDWRAARCLHLSKTEREAKLRAVRAYVKPSAPDGTPWSGVLPRPFLHANTSPREVYFAINTRRANGATRYSK